MAEERKKSGVWSLVVTLVIGLPFLYVASFGPACWMAARFQIGQGAVSAAYKPMGWATLHSPQFLGDALNWYMNAGTQHEEVFTDDDGSIGFAVFLPDPELRELHFEDV